MITLQKKNPMRKICQPLIEDMARHVLTLIDENNLIPAAYLYEAGYADVEMGYEGLMIKEKSK